MLFKIYFSFTYIYLFPISKGLTQMPKLCPEWLSFEVAKVVEIEVDRRHNLNTHSRQIEYRELTKIHSMANIAACKHMLH